MSPHFISDDNSTQIYDQAGPKPPFVAGPYDFPRLTRPTMTANLAGPSSAAQSSPHEAIGDAAASAVPMDLTVGQGALDEGPAVEMTAGGGATGGGGVSGGASAEAAAGGGATGGAAVAGDAAVDGNAGRPAPGD